MDNISPKTPIADMLKRYEEEKNIRFHMPGHKGRAKFSEFACMNEVVTYDVTEVMGTDNLHEPKEAILQAEQLLAKAYGANKSFLLVNGATCGILAAVGAAFESGDRVIVDENCHRSVYDALGLFGAIACIMKITFSGLADMTANDENIKGVIITRPDYYGNCLDISKISDLCREQNLILITDEAHGAHLKFAQLGYPVSAVEYSDFTIQSAHKTIGALNQSAYLHLCNRGKAYEGKIRRMLSIFQTSSPSYLILASGDCARAFMQERGSELLEELRDNINWVSNEIEINTPFKVERKLGKTPDRLVINTGVAGLLGYDVERYLRSRSITLEMADSERIVCLCSVFDKREDFEKLADELKEITCNKDIVSKYNESCRNEERRIVISELAEYIGEAVTSDVVKYPPGIPIVKCGEILTTDKYNIIKELYLSGAEIMGIPRKDT